MTEDALRVIDGDGSRSGWDEFWERDTWTQDEVPHGDLASSHRGNIRINFARITQPWLKEAAKCWTRDRLLTGTSPMTMSLYMTDLGHFSAWLSSNAPEVRAPSDLSRELIQDYLLWLRKRSGWAPSTQGRRAVALRSVLDEQADEGLTGMARNVRILKGEMPRAEYRVPKLMGPTVFDQIIDPKNLSLLEKDWHRTMVLALAFSGLRISSVVTLKPDCLREGPDGHDYLAYENVKSKRESLLPIPPELVAQIRAQYAENLSLHGKESEWLLPSPPIGMGNGKGPKFHVTPVTCARALNRYAERADIRTQDGDVAHFNPHLFRHNLATTLVNDGVSTTVIQHVLDHSSPGMTNLYAHLHDETVRDAMSDWHERVNRRGESVGLAKDGPMQLGQWMKESMSHAKQTLSNGYCGLPLIQTCPHPNACLTCDNFLTDESFRPIHEQQIENNELMIIGAKESGNERLVELLESDQTSLHQIVGGLDAVRDSDTAGETTDFDLRDMPEAS